MYTEAAAAAAAAAWILAEVCRYASMHYFPDHLLQPSAGARCCHGMLMCAAVPLNTHVHTTVHHPPTHPISSWMPAAVLLMSEYNQASRKPMTTVWMNVTICGV